MVALAKSYQCNKRIVSTLISGFERAFAPEVADRVHAPGGMVHEEHAQCATPQESSQPTTKLPSSDQPDCEWCHEIAHHDNKREAAVYRHHHGIIQQIRDIALPRCLLVGKQPAEVGMDKASLSGHRCGRHGGYADRPPHRRKHDACDGPPPSLALTPGPPSSREQRRCLGSAGRS